MEAWLLADPDALGRYYGSRFNASRLPAEARLESIPKAQIVPALDRAAAETPKKRYDKGRDSFALLATLDTARIEAASPWARRFFETLRRDLALRRDP